MQWKLTKRGAQSLRMKMRNAELNLKGPTIMRLSMLSRWGGGGRGGGEAGHRRGI